MAPSLQTTQSFFKGGATTTKNNNKTPVPDPMSLTSLVKFNFPASKPFFTTTTPKLNPNRDLIK
jgi:hypothetical protein